MGILSQYGRPDGPDMKTATGWVEKSAGQGNPIAQYLSVKSHENGNGVSRDMEKARYYYEQASKGKQDILKKEFPDFEERIKNRNGIR